MSQNIQAIVLAGGTSERFKTGKTKLIEKICGKEMIMYPLELLDKISIPTTLVLGHQEDLIKNILKKHKKNNLTILQQEEPLGSGHAASLTQSHWKQEHILLMGADIPLLTTDIIKKLYNKHVKTDADISFITAHGIDIENKNYCRIIINDNKIHVLDSSTATQDLDSQCCISGGVYIAKKSFLEKYIDKLSKGISNEYYLPELVQIASNNNCKIVTSPVSIDSIRCVDTLADLWAIEHIKRSQIIQHWMNNGVRFTNALNVMIDQDVVIEPGAYIGSGAHLLGNTVIKSHSKIGAYSYIKNSTIEKNCSVKSHTVITNSIIAENSVVWPFTHIDHQGIMTPKQTTKNNKINTKNFTGATKTNHLNSDL